MIRLFFLFICILLFTITNAQHIPSLGIPNTQNYTKSQYKAGNQNWSITQDKDGLLYAGNNNGLLVFDGTYWDIYPLTNQSLVRSVAISPDGRIYVGGKEEFGYFEKIKGKLTYHKLSTLVDPAQLENDEIWKILFLDDAVIFQSFSKFYIYKNDKIGIQYGEGEPFLFAHQVNKNIWMEKIPSGLHKWSTNKFIPLEDKLSTILTILPFEQSTFLVGTAKEGLYLLSADGKVDKWEPNIVLDRLLKEAQINNGLKISADYFAIGTIKSGIFIIDKKGTILQHIHTRNGLQNNTVLSMTLDQQGNIWAGLDNGIDRIEINSPFFYYKDIFGELGTVYAIKIFNNHIYLGTNQGLFYSHWSERNNFKNLNLQFIPGSQGQVWSLDIFNNQLICGHNEGTFLVDGDKMQKISSWTGGWVNKQVLGTPNLFLQGNYTGLATFHDANSWRLQQKFGTPKSAVIDLIQIDKDHFWMILNSSIELIQFTPDYKVVKILKTFSFATDFPTIKRIMPSVVKGNLLFMTNKGVFIYDNVLSKFKSYEELNKKLGSFANSHRIKDLKNNSYIFSNEGHFAKVSFNKENLIIDSTSFSSLENTVMENHEVVEPFQQKLLFGLDNGIAIYDHSFNQKSVIKPPIVKGFQFLSSEIDSIQAATEVNAISSDKNSIRILFSSPWYASSPLKYQYILEGIQNQWSTPSEVPFVDFTNLKWGSYTFKVRSIGSSGDMSEITTLEFEILAPWYITWKAILIYILLIGVATYYARKHVIQKLKRNQLHLHRKIQDEQAEVLRMENEQNERKLMALKNKQLSQELELKERELANAATNILYKNELLNNLHEELSNIKDSEGKKLSNDQLQKVSKLMNNARSDERDWDLFEKSFNESHVNFFKKLKANYPTLSPNDLKLCAYLRLNMSSKDIASLINISIRGVEIRRYRLRKKFNLSTDINLTEFLIEL